MSEKDNKLNKGSFLYINDEEKAEWGQPEGYPWKEIETILDGTFEFADYDGIYMHQIADENFTLIDGKTYTIIWDDEVYQCIATSFHYDIIILGNLGINEGPDTGEPFLFMQEDVGSVDIITRDTSATHTITVCAKTIFPISVDFLPTNFLTVIINATFTDNSSGERVQFDLPDNEIIKLVQSNINVIMKIKDGKSQGYLVPMIDQYNGVYFTGLIAEYGTTVKNYISVNISNHSYKTTSIGMDSMHGTNIWLESNYVPELRIALKRTGGGVIGFGMSNDESAFQFDAPINFYQNGKYYRLGVDSNGSVTATEITT